MPDAYIDRHGRLQRQRQLFPKFQIYSSRRTLFLITSVMGAICFISNPENNININLPTIPFISSSFFSKKQKDTNSKGNYARPINKSRSKRNKIGSINLSWLGVEMDIFESPTLEYIQDYSRMKKERLTNYILFSLSQMRDGIYMVALNRKWRLCKFDNLGEVEGHLCETLAENLCHEMKMFHPEYRAFTAYRIIMFLLIFHSLFTAFFQVTVPSSIISQPPVFQDYIYSYFYLYPSLNVLDKVITKGYGETNNSFIYFLNVGCFFFIGAICHRIVKILVNSRGNRDIIRGSRIGAYATALGYQMAFQNQLQRQFIFRLWQVNMEFDASSILLGHTIFHAFSIFSGRDDTNAFGELLVWILSALAGKELGNTHADQYGGAWWTW